MTPEKRQPRYYIKPVDPRCALLVRPSRRLREVMEDEGYTEVDADCYSIHRRAFPVRDDD